MPAAQLCLKYPSFASDIRRLHAALVSNRRAIETDFQGRVRVGLDDFIRDVAARIQGHEGERPLASRSQGRLQRPDGGTVAESHQSLPQLRSRALVPPNTSLASYTSLVRDVRTVLGKHSGLSAYEAARYSTTAAIQDAGQQHPSLLARGAQEGSAVHAAATAATGPASRRARRGREEDSAGRDVPVWTTDHEIAFQLYCEYERPVGSCARPARPLCVPDHAARRY